MPETSPPTTSHTLDVDAIVGAHKSIAPPDNRRYFICMQYDIGANRCVTNEKHTIARYKDIDTYPMGGVEKDELKIVCTGKRLSTVVLLRRCMHHGSSILFSGMRWSNYITQKCCCKKLR